MIWTFGRKVAVGFGLSLVMLLIVGVVGYRSIDALLDNNARVTHTHVVLDKVQQVLVQMRDAETGQRGFIITADESFLEPYNNGLAALPGTIAEIRRLTSDNPRQVARLDDLEKSIQLKVTEMKRVIEERRTKGFEAGQRIVSDGAGKRFMDDIRRIAAQMEQDERDQLRVRSEATEGNAEAAKKGVALASLLAFVLVALAGLAITRSLSAQLTAFVTSIRSASTELQTAAAQQASGSREQLSATTEVATTIRELLATSRQISESAQRVTQVAEQTAFGAKTGTATMHLTGETIAAIKRQMDLVVGHMLDLGKKSQQAGGILELVNELAEQTNILAINATIEAAGAGEAGRRFSVVADEIRKLADRVGGSTKEIRSLIDDMRASVNTTVMATESGVKAVDAGSARFADVTSAFNQIAALVGTSTDASREIELSTKQQTTAVEQVSIAIGNVAQATREADSSAKQTLDAASALTDVSRKLLLLVDASST